MIVIDATASYETFSHEVYELISPITTHSVSLYTYTLLIFTAFAIIFFVEHLRKLYALHIQPTAPPHFACVETPLNREIIRRIESLGNYVAPWWYNPHVHSLIPFGKCLMLPYFRELHIHNDGTSFPVDWYPCKPTPQTQRLKICVFVPGNGTSSSSAYVTKFARFLADTQGYHVAVLGARGLDAPLASPKIWHFALTDDLSTLLRHLYHHYPGTPVCLSGFSAGTNIILNTLLHRDTPTQHVKAVFLCCVNYCYRSARGRLESHTSYGWIYSRLLALQFKSIVKKNISYLEQHYGEHIHRTLSCSTMSELDAVCHHIFNYDTEEALYDAYSGLKHACRELSIPMLLLQPADDPLHLNNVRENIPVSKLTVNENIIYMETAKGCHFGFVEGPLLEAFSNEATYTYPAKVASMLFNTVLSSQK